MAWPKAAATINSSNVETSNRLYTLYFIRHAEALHNQLEKVAQTTALSLAISQGHASNSPHAKKVQEEARMAILESDGMGDPPLSELGFEEAQKAKITLERLIATYNLPHVEEVWVSPLQRTLQTAATIFPDSPSPYSVGSLRDGSTNAALSTRPPIIRAKKEIEERQTGLPCDMHSSFEEIRSRKSFRRFSLSCLNIEDHALDGNNDNDTPPFTVTASAVEEKPMLRERTKKLFNLLAETKCRSICVIAHKGYLRELERGPLGKPGAEQFQNGEVRVYRLHLDVEGAAKALDGNCGVLDCEDGSRLRQGSVIVDGSTSSGNVGLGGRLGRKVPVLQRAEQIVASTIMA